MATDSFNLGAGVHLGSPWIDLTSTFTMAEIVGDGNGNVCRENGGSWTQGALWPNSDSDDCTVTIAPCTETVNTKLGPVIRGDGVSAFYHIHTQDIDAGHWVYLNMCRADTPIGNGLIALDGSHLTNTTHTIRLTAETLADRVRLRVWLDGVLMQFPNSEYYLDDTDAGRFQNIGHTGIYMAITGQVYGYGIAEWTDGISAAPVTVRVYEQGQGTVLNGDGDGTLMDRGSPFDISSLDLSVGDHTLEVTEEDTGDSKAESNRVSTGQFTIDPTGQSDTFNGAAGALNRSGHPWGDGNSDFTVNNYVIDGSGNCKTSAYLHAGARRTNSNSDISRLTMAGFGDTNPDELNASNPGPFVRSRGTVAAPNGGMGYLCVLGNADTVSPYNWRSVYLAVDYNDGHDGNKGWYLGEAGGYNWDRTAIHEVMIEVSGDGPVTIRVFVDGTKVTFTSASSDDGATIDGNGDIIHSSGGLNGLVPIAAGAGTNPGFKYQARADADNNGIYQSWQDY